MFFDQIKRNSKRSRRENGLYFGSLIVAIVSFYILLSLGEQDVMTFLKTMESDAVQRLLLLIPMVYMLSLFFVFFLVYFASRYQLQRRSHEFGIYQMLGMKRSTLFSMLMGETILNSVIALLIGIPAALFLTELISMSMAKLVGLGIIGHQFRLSIPGLGGTVAGFLAVQLMAMLILSFSMSRKEPIQLLKDEKESSQKILSTKTGWLALIFGILLLLAAYGLGIFLLRTFSQLVTLTILVTGILGTFLLFKGLGTFIGHKVYRKSEHSTGLYTFTGRQLQENVLNQSKSLAVSSLLILLAMICVSFGVGAAIGSGVSLGRTTDFSFQGNQAEIEKVLNSEEIRPYVYSYYPMYIDHLRTHNNVDKGHEFSWSGLKAAVEALPDSSEKQGILENLSDNNYPYFISLSGYNNLRKTTGKQEITLTPGEVALYSSGQFQSVIQEFQQALQKQAFVTIDGVKYPVSNQLQSDNLVADRSITIMEGLVVPDEMYKVLIEDKEPFCWNMVMKPEYIQEKGLMQGMNHVNSLLSKTGIEYESYLKSMGRQLFYVVGVSYLTLYIGILFLIIANTVLGLKFLMQQRSTRHRYETLLTLGAKEDELCVSARAQIRMFFGLVISAAVVSSVFGIWSMLTSFLKLPNPDAIHSIIPIAGGAMALFVLLELIYIRIIEGASDREIRGINIIDRG